MLKRIVVFVIIIISAIINLQAGDTSDTVWTKELWQLGDQIYQVQFTPDSQSVAVAIGGGVYVFDIKTGNIVKQFNKFMYICKYFDITNDGLKLITSSYDENYIGKIIVWDYQKEDTIKVFNETSIQDIKIYDENSIIGIWNLPKQNIDSSKICLFDFNTGIILKNKSVTGQNTYIDANAFSVLKQCNLFALVKGYNSLKAKDIFLYDLTTFENITKIGSHENVINDLSFSPDGKYLASASSDGYIKVWDVESKQLYKSFLHDNTGKDINTIKISPDSKYIVSGIIIWNKWNTKIWDIYSGELIYKYNYGLVAGLDILSDKKYIAGGNSSLLYLLNAKWESNSIDEQNKDIIKNLYPNPTGVEITIPIELGIIPREINISDISGNIVNKIINIIPNDNKITINISTLPIGNYYVSVIYNDKIISYKFNKIR